MTPFKDQPIARKAIILGFAPAASALVIASVAFLLSTFVSMRRSVVDDVSTSAAMLADSVNVALGFKDVETVRELAGALRENRSIDHACVFDETGVFVAGYARPGEDCPARLDSSLQARRTQVARTHPILIGNRPVGTVRVTANLDHLYETVAAQATVTLLVLAGALGVALLLVRHLQRAIAHPIAQLASTAEEVSRTDDYSLRAEQTTNDEVGRLVRSFNTMLGAVQRSEQERAGLLDRERESSRLKDEFLATVSHELRTPLNAILGWTHILTMGVPAPETLDKGLKTIHRNAKVQTRLIEDLIEVSRIATGKLNLRLEVVDVRDVVRQSVEGLLGAARAKGVALDMRVPAEPSLVSGDRDRLQQIVSNLVNNALKFTPSGGAIMVTLAPGDGELVLRVRDTGIGMPAEFLPHVFERFRQADGSTTREFGGLGLGLAIVRDLVQLHHGSVSAHSGGRGLGSEFFVHLPRVVDVPASSTAREKDVRPAALPGVRVLAVDDNADALEMLTTALANTGADVATATTGTGAVEQWKRAPADVLICDLAIPGMDGFTVMQIIRELDAAAGHRAFAVALSAYTSDDYVQRAREAGFDRHVGKPFDPAKLMSEIAEALASLR